jgi:hypothetical protein
VILDAASAEFGAHGYAEARISAIAARAGGQRSADLLAEDRPLALAPVQAHGAQNPDMS